MEERKTFKQFVNALSTSYGIFNYESLFNFTTIEEYELLRKIINDYNEYKKRMNEKKYLFDRYDFIKLFVCYLNYNDIPMFDSNDLKNFIKSLSDREEFNDIYNEIVNDITPYNINEVIEYAQLLGIVCYNEIYEMFDIVHDFGENDFDYNEMYLDDMRFFVYKFNKESHIRKK